MHFISSIVLNTIGPLAIRWAPCLDGRTPPTTLASFVSVAPL